MAGMKERLIQYVLRGKDELSPAASKASEAMGELAAESEKLTEALDSAKDARGLINGLQQAERAIEQAQRSMVQGDLQIKELREALDKSPESAGLQQSLKEAEREARKAGRQLDKLRVALDEQRQAAGAAGVDTQRLAEEEKRLAAAIEQGQRALTENAEAVARLKREEVAAARATEELEERKKATAKAARDLLARQREGAQAQEEYNQGLATGVKRLAAYAAGLFALGSVFGTVRNGIVSMLRTGDEFELLTKRLSSLMGSLEGGERATAWIREFAKSTPLAVAEVADAFAQLKAFGLDPMDGSLQALVDQNEKLGGGQERLLGIVSAVGQAWAKQKLQTEEILQLVERGVPAWDLLAQVTGKSGEALADMASKGQLGRDVIQQLLAEIQRTSQGAAASSMSTLTGLVSNLRDSWAGFLDRVANSGALDHVKGRLSALAATIEQMAADGSLDRMAQRASDSFVSLAKAVEGAGQWIARNATELKALAAAYAAFKLAGMVTAMAKWAVSVQVSATQMRVLTAETNAAAAATARLSAAQVLTGGFAKLGAGVTKAASALGLLTTRLAGWAGVAMLAADAGKPLGEWLAKMSPAVKEAEAAIARANQAMREQYDAAMLAASGLAKNAGIQLRSAADLKTATESERQAYAERLKALEQYQKAQLRVAIIGREVGEVSSEELAAAQQALAATRQSFKDLDAAATFAGDALKGRLTQGALALVEQFTQVRRSGEDVEAALASIGEGFDPSNTEQMRDLGVALQYLGQYGQASGEQIEQFLIERLKHLSGEELAKVLESARAAFSGMERGAEALGNTLDAGVNAALQRLGLDLEQVATGFDKSTRDTISAFEGVIEAQTATGRSAEENAKVITAAYLAARDKIDDPNALKKLEAAYQGWANTSTAAATAARQAMKQVAQSTDEAGDNQKALRTELERTTGVGREAGEQLTKSQEMYNAALEDSILANEELRRISGQRMEEERRASGEAMERQRKGIDTTKKDMSAMSDFFGGVLTQARQPLAQMSAAALEAYDRLSGIKSVDMSIDTSSLEATRESLRRVSEAMAATQAAAGAASSGPFSRWQAEALLRSQQIQASYLGQKATLQSLMEGYADGSMTVEQFVRRAKSAKHTLGLLDKSDLSSLRSAIQSAEQQMESLGDSTRNTLEGLQMELLQLKGTQDQIERARFQSRRREIQAQMEEARKSGNSQSVSNLQQSLGVLDQIERESANKRRREAQQQTEAAPAATPAAPAKVIRLETSRGQSVEVGLPSEADETRLLGILESAGLRSL